MKDPQQYGYFLLLFTILLYFRVLGQIVVVLWNPRWLPPMEQWQSGLLPYRVLLAGQIVVLTLMTLITADFLEGSGYFVDPHPAGGRFSTLFAYGYALWMVVRYINRMARKPDQRWVGGTIPIIFHCVVAAFLWTWGHYQTSNSATSNSQIIQTPKTPTPNSQIIQTPKTPTPNSQQDGSGSSTLWAWEVARLGIEQFGSWKLEVGSWKFESLEVGSWNLGVVYHTARHIPSFIRPQTS